MKDTTLGNQFELAGILAQTAVDAAEKKLFAICSKYGEEGAFWQIRITLDLANLNENFSEIMQTVRVTETFNANWPEDRPKDKV